MMLLNFVSAIVQIPKRVVVERTPDVIEGGGTWNEWLSGPETWTNPYFDTEAYYETDPGPEEHQRVLSSFKDNVAKVCGQEPALTAIYGQRHGHDPKKNKYKVSFRAWLPSFKIKYVTLGPAIRAAGVFGDTDGLLDASVYTASEQLLGCIGCHKGKMKGGAYDTRVLEPMEPGRPFTDYLVQHLKGDELELAVAFDANPAKKEKKKKPADRLQTSSSTETPLTTEEGNQLVRMFSDEGVDDYGTWVDRLMLLKTLDIDVQAAREWSMKGQKFDEDGFSKTWESLNPNGQLTVASIFHFAKLGDPVKFRAFLRQRTKGLAEHVIESGAGHVPMVQLLQCSYPGIFKGVSDRNAVLWHFQDHSWKSGGRNYVIQTLVNEVLPRFEDLLEAAKKARDALLPDSSPEGIAKLNAAKTRVKNVTFVVSRLHNNGYKNRVVDELASLEYDPDFLSRLDEDRYLIGFDDGVYDLRAQAFRHGQPSDHVSFTTGYAYEPTVDPDVRTKIMGVLASCFETTELLDYMLDTLCMCVCGHRTEEAFYVWTGTGGNGKSLVAELALNTFGDYGSTIDESYFTTHTRSSSSATPELANKNGVRIVITSEPEENGGAILIGKVKKITGGDVINARQLYAQEIRFKPQFGVFLLANDTPALSRVDGGILRRLKVLEWVYKFVAEPSLAEGSREKKEDLSIKEGFLGSLVWKQQFMLLLLERFHARPKGGACVPDAVQAATNKYLEESNPLGFWFSERVVLDPEASTKKADWYADYRTWCRFNGEKEVGPKVATQTMLRVYGPRNGISMRRSGGTVFDGFRLEVDEAILSDT
ncbi:hypothetical protein WJX72_004974 [[Myrmecia] bisecta]|uniref:SF3 helicase domain-containing protein n=1 Tax=[Myrmecia] bisecta TaxID=41462 RepID=A0AAW1PAR7_9CHLO